MRESPGSAGGGKAEEPLLSDVDRRLVWMVSRGYDQSEIALRLGMPRTLVLERFERTLRRMTETNRPSE